MWFVFPQIAGLGRSETARFYALADRDEAAAYARHPVLGPRLRDSTSAMLGWVARKSAEEILGSIDALKFKSSMTLFEASTEDPAYGAALDGFYRGERDPLTLVRL